MPMPLVAKHHRYPMILPRVWIKGKASCAGAPGQPARYLIAIAPDREEGLVQKFFGRLMNCVSCFERSAEAFARAAEKRHQIEQCAPPELRTEGPYILADKKTRCEDVHAAPKERPTGPPSAGEKPRGHDLL
jgi:hypothetical protein